jgi:hypothetical protein
MRIRGALIRIAAGSIGLFAAYSMLLCFPEPLFSFSVRADSLVLHSDRIIEEPATRQVLELAEAKLLTSPLYSKNQDHDVFICNSRWRQMLLFNKDYGVAGVVQYPISSNAFVRDASFADNRLISPRGVFVPGDRTLDYFIAHEVTHQITGRAIGPVLFYRLPQWVREGYADYVGKGSSFHYDDARRAFLAGASEMDFKKTGQYRRFHLLVAYMLDHRGWSVMKLLQHPPAQDEIEAEVRNEVSR